MTKKKQKISATEQPPFDATLRPTAKTRVAVLASLTMATPVFSVGFGNIFIRTVASHVNDINCHVPSHSYKKNRHFVSTHVTITYCITGLSEHRNVGICFAASRGLHCVTPRLAAKQIPLFLCSLIPVKQYEL